MRNTGKPEAPPEDVYATHVHNLLAAAMLFEHFAVEGDIPEDLTLRRGLTLVRDAKMQQKTYSLASTDRLAS
jgi:hypothetical protein